MIKAVNMKNYPVMKGKRNTKLYVGFGIMDTESGKFASVGGGKTIFTAKTKKVANNVIECCGEDYLRTTLIDLF